MNYLIAYLLTVVSSFGISTINELIMYKDAANKGYRIDSRTINNFKFRKENKIPKNMSFLMFLPVVNIINAYKNLLSYEIRHDKIIDKLDETDAVTIMSNKEQKTYKKFPTGITSALLNVREKIELSEFASVPVDKSKIYYDLDDEGQFEIQKVTGPLSKRPVTDQIEALKNYREMLLKSQQINLTNQPRIRVRGK